MSMAHGRTGLKAAVVALGLLAAGASAAQASPLVNYSTSGQIDSSGVTGTPVISFNSILNGVFNAPSQFSLGNFQVAALPDSQTTTYNNTPFHITYLVNTVDGNKPEPNETPIQISGVLNGSISGSNQSNVVAKFDPLANPTFLTGPWSNTVSLFNNPLSLVPSTTNSGQTSAQANLTTTPVQPVPEPTTMALFLTALGGLGYRRLRGRKAA